MHTLLCVDQQHNLNAMIATCHYQPKKVILLTLEKTENSPPTSVFHEYLKKEGYQTLTLHVDASSPTFASSIINELLDPADSICILPVNGNVFGYHLFTALQSSKIQFALVENDGDIYHYHNHQFSFVDDSADLTVYDYIESKGGEIISDSSVLFSKEASLHLLTFLEDHYNEYLALFRYKQPRKPFIYSDEHRPNSMIFSLRNLSVKERDFLHLLATFMYKEKIAWFTYTKNQKLLLHLSDPAYKSYLLKTGTWLEHRLFHMLTNMGMDDIEASVSFLWNRKLRANNEVDVVAIYHNQLLMISCKDTKEVGPEQINEIYTNALHLGNKDAIKILFTTTKPPASLYQKAKEFHVHIVQYTFDIKATMKELYRIVTT